MGGGILVVFCFLTILEKGWEMGGRGEGVFSHLYINKRNRIRAGVSGKYFKEFIARWRRSSYSSNKSSCSSSRRSRRRSGDVAQWVQHRTGMPRTQVRLPGTARDCINVCAHVQDPVVHVKVRCIMETLKKNTQHVPKVE